MRSLYSLSRTQRMVHQQLVVLDEGTSTSTLITYIKPLLAQRFQLVASIGALAVRRRMLSLNWGNFIILNGCRVYSLVVSCLLVRRFYFFRNNAIGEMWQPS